MRGELRIRLELTRMLSSTTTGPPYANKVGIQTRAPGISVIRPPPNVGPPSTTPALDDSNVTPKCGRRSDRTAHGHRAEHRT